MTFRSLKLSLIIWFRHETDVITNYNPSSSSDTYTIIQGIRAFWAQVAGFPSPASGLLTLYVGKLNFDMSVACCRPYRWVGRYSDGRMAMLFTRNSDI